MSEIGDSMKILSEVSREKKRRNLAYSTNLLKEEGIEFESKNNGVHLVIHHMGQVWDFWPSTGKFGKRGSGHYGRDVKNLLRELR